MSELEPFFDASRGDTLVDLSKLENWSEPAPTVINKYKNINISSLYGSNKPCGPLAVEHIKYTGPFTKKRMSKGRML